MGQHFDDKKRIEGTIEEMFESSLAFIRLLEETADMVENRHIGIAIMRKAN